MAKYFQKELDRIKKMILSLGASVEERVRMASTAIDERNCEQAEKIIKTDYMIDEMEVDIEEECLKALALYQPVAVDLRFLTATIKINNDLERIADETVNIARRVQTIASNESGGFVFDFSAMTEHAEKMLRMSLDALVNFDLDTALKVVMMDDAIDNMHHDAYDRIKLALKDTLDANQEVGTYINLYLISRHLERIGDHATNIAEEVIYLVEGEIVRHSDY